jgi:hypothetical protein
MTNLLSAPFTYRMLSGIAMMALAVAPAEADVINAAWSDHTTWIYEIGHMPDLDQRRPSLPGDGNMYCVPTAVMNKMIYIANHGYPNLAPPPGPGNWQSQSRFNDASTALSDMGSLMGTTTADGTFTNGWEKGAKIWVNSRYPGLFVVNRYSRSGSYWPKVSHIGQTALSGGLISFAFGRYSYDGDPEAPLFTVLGRHGGHAITLAKAAQSGNSILLESRDPWHEAPEFDLATQSVFANRVYTVRNHVIFENGAWFGVNSLNANSENDRVAIVDGYQGIFPIYGYGYTPGGHTILIYKPIQISNSQSPALNIFNFSATLGASATIVDATIHPDTTSMYAIVDSEQGKVVAQMGAMSGDVAVLRDVPEGKKMTFGRNRLLYVLEDQELHQVHIDIVPEEPGDPPPIQSMALPFSADAIEFMDAQDLVGILSTSENALMLFQTNPVTDELPMRPLRVNIAQPLAGAASMAFPPEPVSDEDPAQDPSVWVISEASDSIFRIALADGSVMDQISMPAISSPTDISINDIGDLFVSTPGGMFQLSETDEGWMIVPSLFDGEEVALERFEVARSRSNYHPALHDGPGWRNIELEDGEVENRPDDQVYRDRFDAVTDHHH